MAFSTRVLPAVLKTIRNPVICANVARKARRGKFSKDIFLPFNIDVPSLRMTFSLYSYAIGVAYRHPRQKDTETEFLNYI